MEGGREGLLDEGGEGEEGLAQVFFFERGEAGVLVGGREGGREGWKGK